MTDKVANDADALFGKGLQFWNQGRFSESTSVFAMCAADEPHLSRSWRYLTSSLRAEARFSEAAIAFRGWQANAGDDLEAAQARMFSKFYGGDYRAAAAASEILESTSPWLMDIDIINRKEIALLWQALMHQPDWSWARYNLAKRQYYDLNFTLESAARSLGRSGFIVQVGANDGVRNDPVRPLIVGQGWRAMLIEPVPWVFEQLKANYASSCDVEFVQCAVSVAEGPIDMVCVDPRAISAGSVPRSATGLSGIGGVRNTIGKFKDHVVPLRVHARRLDSLLKERDIADVDYLQIDTEGHDFDVLSTLDFRVVRPKIINIEVCCLPSSEREALLGLLMMNEYYYRPAGRDIVAVDQSIMDKIRRKARRAKL